jgi:hypothetical protein
LRLIGIRLRPLPIRELPQIRTVILSEIVHFIIAGGFFLLGRQ